MCDPAEALSMASTVSDSSLGEKRNTHTHTHDHYNRLLWLCVKAFPPVTGPVRRVEGCVKCQCERVEAGQQLREAEGTGQLYS